jgi:hypothetical protein
MCSHEAAMFVVIIGNVKEVEKNFCLEPNIINKAQTADLDDSRWIQ